MQIRAASLAVAALLALTGRLEAQSPKSMLRVIDSATQQPIDRAEVLAPGRATMRTSDSGTVSLSFLKDQSSRIVVRRVGYESKSVDVGAGATGTITVALSAIAKALPEVTTKAAPLNHKLEVMGFYERMKSSAAPRSAFVTAEDLERWKPTVLSDVKYKTGRAIDRCATYLDGAVIDASKGPQGNTLRRGIDALVQPSEVAAMEVYRISEAPTRFTPTQKRLPPCVLLIWTK